MPSGRWLWQSDPSRRLGMTGEPQSGIRTSTESVRRGPDDPDPSLCLGHLPESRKLLGKQLATENR